MLNAVIGHPFVQFAGMVAGILMGMPLLALAIDYGLSWLTGPEKSGPGRRTIAILGALLVFLVVPRILHAFPEEIFVFAVCEAFKLILWLGLFKAFIRPSSPGGFLRLLALSTAAGTALGGLSLLVCIVLQRPEWRVPLVWGVVALSFIVVPFVSRFSRLKPVRAEKPAG